MEKLNQVEDMDVDLNPNQNDFQNENKEVKIERTSDVNKELDIDIKTTRNKNIQCLIKKTEKRIVKKQEKEKKLSKVIIAKNNIISNHVKYQKTTNDRQLASEKINTNVTQYKEEMPAEMQPTSSNSTEIFNELNDFVKTFENNFAKKNNEYETFFKNVDERKNLIENELKIKKAKVQKLKARLKSLKSEIVRKEQINHKYSLLKDKIAKKRENLSKLKSNYKSAEKKTKLSQEIKDLQNECDFKITTLDKQIEDREIEIDFDGNFLRNSELEKEISDTYKQMTKLQESTKNTQKMFESELLEFAKKNNKISEMKVIGKEDKNKLIEENLSRLNYIKTLMKNFQSEFYEIQTRNNDKIKILSELMEKQSRVSKDKLLNSELLKGEGQVKNAEWSLERFLEHHPEFIGLDIKIESLNNSDKNLKDQLKYMENTLKQLRLSKQKYEEELKQLGDETLSEDEPSCSQKESVVRSVVKKSPSNFFKRGQFSKISSTDSKISNLPEISLNPINSEDIDETLNTFGTIKRKRYLL